ncbi:hypothetical protein P4V58_14090 [Bacillus wiedmannii]|uniref:hypothetical protein n=1 Tax=Bacillus wiedmannii TaxID=1890302 RepID=UPI002E22C215|nr:hypothetical protein [Bacillus wiedmannii]
MGDILKDNKSNKILKVGTNIILVLLLIGAIQMFYDGDYTNDYYGWLFLVVFWMIKGISSFMVSLKEGDKKSIFIDLGLVLGSFYLILVYSMKYFF